MYVCTTPESKESDVPLDLVAEVDVHGLDGGVVLERVLAELAADTRLLEAAEWYLWVELVRAVDLRQLC